MAWNQKLGRAGEQHVARWLEDHGVIVVARNWRGTAGEADLIGDDGARLRVVEVKTRSSGACGHPLEAIDSGKYRRLWKLGNEFRDGYAYPRDIVVDAAAVSRRDQRWTVEYLADVRP
ncbi:YraN family protein [Arthrobacter sp. UM1]|uniref:YraN family protein n=1 Tax=Arthrobacter sp. UM1 TaxID=2766776 RepID=UPI001CF6BB65|nr:YraN family protein [Arthrobacter sp. UM1]MCB4207330.1 YraN family protein [Arthrobacter sp. UM1]